jgi:hypothetical protein
MRIVSGKTDTGDVGQAENKGIPRLWNEWSFVYLDLGSESGVYFSVQAVACCARAFLTTSFSFKT